HLLAGDEPDHDEHRLHDDERAHGCDQPVRQGSAAVLGPGCLAGAEDEPQEGAERQHRRPTAVRVAVEEEAGDEREGHGEHDGDRRALPDRLPVPAPRCRRLRRIAHHAAPPQGELSPSLPGLRMPTGSSACFTAASTSRPVPSASPTKRERLSPTPWWWLRLPPAASVARAPASHSARYVDSTSSGRGVAEEGYERTAPRLDA